MDVGGSSYLNFTYPNTPCSMCSELTSYLSFIITPNVWITDFLIYLFSFFCLGIAGLTVENLVTSRVLMEAVCILSELLLGFVGWLLQTHTHTYIYSIWLHVTHFWKDVAIGKSQCRVFFIGVIAQG